jgi:predicted nuclease of restriction endonuclease-like (RecB) superfamily
MLINNDSYFQILEDVKTRIRDAQYKAVLGVNREQILLYWSIGKAISANVQYGSSFINNLARDIKMDFPKAKGYSARNLRYMRKFADLVDDERILQTVSANLSWSHNTHLFDKTNSLGEYLWYATQTIENGWSLTSLEYHTDTKAFVRQALPDKMTNYLERLPTPQSELVLETLKDPFVFDFVEQRERIMEKEIEDELVANIAKTILELGTGFAFVGNQYMVSVSGVDYEIDLLFYNLRLRCYVAIELKRGKFLPEYAGKMNFYLSALDKQVKHEFDNPSIGIILCKTKDNLTAEYALQDINKPIGIAEYKLSDFLPEELAHTLPSAEDIEKRIKVKYHIEED